MAKSCNQKAKILYLERMLRGTGEDHVITMQAILAGLLEHGISAERKSIYDDIETLRSFGMDVRFRRGRPGGYYIAGQTAGEAAQAADAAGMTETAQAADAAGAAGTAQAADAAGAAGTAQAADAAGAAGTVQTTDAAGMIETAQAADVAGAAGTAQAMDATGTATGTVQAATRETASETAAWSETAGREMAASAESEPVNAPADRAAQEPAGFRPRAERLPQSQKQMKLLCSSSVRKEVEAFFGKNAQYKTKGLDSFTVTAGLMKDAQFYGWLTAMGKDVHILKPKKAAQSYREYLRELVREYKGV